MVLIFVGAGGVVALDGLGTSCVRTAGVAGGFALGFTGWLAEEPASGESLGAGPATTAELTTAAGSVLPFAPASAVTAGGGGDGSAAPADTAGLVPPDASSTPAAPSAAANTRPPTTSPIRLPLPAGCAIPALG